MSLDGKLTRHDEADVRSWTSNEDKKHFGELVASQDAVVMGRGTYETVKHYLQLQVPVKRIVLTSKPEKFKDEVVKNRLEFYNQTPTQLISRLNQEGLSNILIVGGPKMTTELLRTNLIDQVLVTVEPRLFGQGVSLVSNEKLDIKLKLVSYEKLNDSGTLLLKYEVNKDLGPT